MINLARAARIINTRHATRHPNAIFHLFTLLCSFKDSFLASIKAEKTKKREPKVNVFRKLLIDC